MRVLQLERFFQTVRVEKRNTLSQIILAKAGVHNIYKFQVHAFFKLQADVNAVLTLTTDVSLTIAQKS